ncbi:MAG: SGNH/GDSL hydrolase family protein [Clostridia bacterium]|nr:SGNH/GDSL hydrolase family protein [Clostridia bacterium]
MKKKVIIIGSSVCYGDGTPNHGWSRLLQERLETKGYEVSNCSVPGNRAADILMRLQRDVIDQKPDYCIVGLGLPNDGFALAVTPEEQLETRTVFEYNVKYIVRMLHEKGIRVILGGLYPNNNYTPEHAVGLEQTEANMKTWGVPVLSWLDALSDGHGHYKDGLTYDGAHPTKEGHRLMYECIPENIIELCDQGKVIA